MKKIFIRFISLTMCCLLIFGGSVSVFAADVNINRISCVVNGDASSQRGFCWYTDVNTDTKIVVYNDLGEDVTDSLVVKTESSAWQGNFMHKAVVSGLQPGTSYTYKVGDGVNWSETGSFTTDSGEDKLDFIFYADPQASSESNFETASKVVRAALEVMPNPDFTATMGDFTNDCTNEEWDAYSKYFGEFSLATTFVPVAGNHDSDSNWFKNMFALDMSESVQTKTGVNYSFDYGNVHIAVCNTNDLISMSDAQLNWLKNDMNSTSADWKIVMMHKAPYSLGKDGKWPDALYLQEALTAVCDETNVDIVLSGHDHMYLRTKALNDNKVVSQENGTTYVLSGTVGTKRYEIRPFSVDRFMMTDFIDACVIQKSGYGNYYNGVDFESVDENNIGGCFNTISVRGGTLVLNSYILSDELGTVKNTDTLEITKAQGENTPTFSGDNSASRGTDISKEISTFSNLLKYTLTVWLPMFIKALPDILKSVIQYDIF